MSKPLHQFILFLLLSFVLLPSARVMGRGFSVAVVVDDEYDRYKKRGDEFFKEGRYVEARRQYQNCLEVPGFENDAYAKEQIAECTTGLTLRQQADDALRGNRGPEAVKLFGQLLNINPDDAITKMQLADYHERIGNQLFNQKRYLEARTNYTEALKFATATKRESLVIQIQTIDDILKPSKRIGLKVFTGLVAVGAGAYAYLLRNDYQSKMSTLNQISQTADPTGGGVIANSDTYRQYNEAYDAAQAAQQKNGLFKACVGVAALATIAEIYLLVHKPKPRTTALQWKPSSQSWGLAISYTF
ncbi:tetratricopeptide repeat protein [Spirosoma flavum]|uniref:Tetratricopeptide repeat protein n=1 Tax=Spirosoma flavum TaxID=2048557 RepID=A0ABW6ANZ0_9BACT